MHIQLQYFLHQIDKKVRKIWSEVPSTKGEVAATFLHIANPITLLGETEILECWQPPEAV